MSAKSSKSSESSESAILSCGGRGGGRGGGSLSLFNSSFESIFQSLQNGTLCRELFDFGALFSVLGSNSHIQTSELRRFVSSLKDVPTMICALNNDRYFFERIFTYLPEKDDAGLFIEFMMSLGSEFFIALFSLTFLNENIDFLLHKNLLRYAYRRDILLNKKISKSISKWIDSIDLSDSSNIAKCVMCFKKTPTLLVDYISLRGTEKFCAKFSSVELINYLVSNHIEYDVYLILDVLIEYNDNQMKCDMDDIISHLYCITSSVDYKNNPVLKETHAMIISTLQEIHKRE